MKKALLLAAILLAGSAAFAANNTEAPSEETPTVKEIPYYLRKLKETALEDKRIEFDKRIHDAVVNADLAQKRVVKQIELLMPQIQQAIDGGLDRMNLSGQANWLQTAKDFFESEKNRRLIDLPASDWLTNQIQDAAGEKISVFPSKIVLHAKNKTDDVVSGSNIHEAVISDDGRRIAYFVEPEAGSKRAELWIYDVKKKSARKVGVTPSCFTLLLALDGTTLFYQEVPTEEAGESNIHRMSVNGGEPKPLGTGTLLSTIVAKGRYKGNLIVFKHSKHHLGVTPQDCPYAVDASSGKEIGRLKDGPCR